MTRRDTLYWDYELVRWLEEAVRNGCDDPEKAKATIIEYKQKIRALVNPEPEEYTETIINCDDCDSYVSLIELPDRVETEEEAREYFEENLRRRARNTMYDCTGDWFTCWYKPFMRRGKWFVYHSVGRDV